MGGLNHGVSGEFALAQAWSRATSSNSEKNDLTPEPALDLAGTRTQDVPMRRSPFAIAATIRRAGQTRPQ